MNGKLYEVKPVSLVNHERLIEDEAMELTFPLEPRYVKPCPSPR